MLDQQYIDQAALLLQQGGVIAYPTEGVYGLGCDPFNQVAWQRILDIKQRPANKAFIVVASEFAQIDNIIDTSAVTDLDYIMTTWPGPVTWIFPLSEKGRTLLLPGLTSLAVRISAHPIIKTVCEQFAKPITSTSANVANQTPLTDYDDVVTQFGKQVDLVIPGNIDNHIGPTPIYDAITKEKIR